MRRRAVLEGHGGGERRRRGPLAAGAAVAGGLLHLPRADRRARRWSPASQTPCGEETETSLARPLILTGRGDRAGLGARRPPARRAAAAAPTHVALRRLGIDAAVYGVDVDTRLGVLDVPQNIDRVGWWRDGAAPGSSAGTILLAGHVDSARRGAGAFYALKNARRGDTITVRSGRHDAQLPRDVAAARAQGRAADEHLHAHAASAGSCS